jgi:isopenicillin N synthase-like dioxygenase
MRYVRAQPTCGRHAANMVFYVVGHGIDEALQQRLEHLSCQFFAQDVATKQLIRMELGSRAWRGYFPVGGQLLLGYGRAYRLWVAHYPQARCIRWLTGEVKV